MATGQTDIAIVGGGIVGNVLARALLAKTDYQITLIDAQHFDANHIHTGFDARVLALANRTVDELTALGLSFNDSNGVPISHIQVSDQGAAGLCQLAADGFSLPHFGRVVSLDTLGQALHKLPAHERLNRLSPVTVESALQHQDNVTLTLNNGDALKARLLVIADGGRSGVASQLGFERTAQDYQQTAIICNVLTSEPHRGRAYERFTPTGPLAFLPFNPDMNSTHTEQNGFSVVWTVARKDAEAAMAMTDNEVIKQLQHAFGYRQGMIEKVSPRFAYPLVLEQASQLTLHRAVVVGNAAQSLHPIAGQGFNLGLRDVITLAESLSATSDPGAFNTLFCYQQERMGDRTLTVSLTDSLVTLFSNTHVPMIAGRNLALMAMDNLPPVQRQFVRHTTGYGRKSKQECRF